MYLITEKYVAVTDAGCPNNIVDSVYYESCIIIWFYNNKQLKLNS